MKQLTQWFSKPYFYFVAGLIFMIPVILIARTTLFYFCYVPLIVAAILFSGPSIPEKNEWRPSILIRCAGFIVGMIVSELAFSVVLIVRDGLSVQFDFSQSDWRILSIELFLGISVFMLFVSISMIVRFFSRKISRPDAN